MRASRGDSSAARGHVLMERQADYPIHPLFLRRGSPRAMAGTPLPSAGLLRLFEAAR
jgi:hypothetical protein